MIKAAVATTEILKNHKSGELLIGQQEKRQKIAILMNLGNPFTFFVGGEKKLLTKEEVK